MITLQRHADRRGFLASVAELCRKSVSAEQLDIIRAALENIVRHEYGDGKLICAQAALAVARA